MTNAEAIAEAKRIEESIEARIAAGEIPPRPEGYDRDAHSTWFTKHLVCAEPTHRYFVRERGHALCRECLNTYGGSGMRYFTSLRLWLTRKEAVKVGQNPVGHIVEAKIKKQPSMDVETPMLRSTHDRWRAR